MIFRFGERSEYELDEEAYELRRDGARVALEPKVLDLLLALVSARDRLVTKQELFERVWPGTLVVESALTRAMSLARVAIGDSGQRQALIETVSGRGYRWRASVSLASERRALPAVEPAPAPARLRRVALVAAALAASLLALGWLVWPAPLGIVLELAGLAPPPSQPPFPEEPSIVVLPFEDLSSAPPGSGVLADGLVDDLTNGLGRFSGLLVIARSSAFTYRGRPVDLRQIGTELGVRYALEDAELARVSRRADAELGAYHALLRAREHWYRFTRADNARARELLLQALERQPDYAYALAMLASNQLAAFALGWDPDPVRVEQAVELAERAMALDAFEPVAFTTLAGARLLQGRPGDAVAAARRAVELGPNSDLCYGVQAMSLAADGRIFEAIRSLERAMRINPREPGLYWMLLGEMQAAGGRIDAALATWETLRARNPDAIPPRIRLAAHFAGSDGARAHDIVREILAINPAFTAEHALRIDPTRRDPRRAASLQAELRAAGLP